MSAALRQETSHVARRRVRHLDVNHVTRQRVEDAIERLIGMLDELDGDPDVEPSLGWSITMATGSADDREIDRVAA